MPLLSTRALATELDANEETVRRLYRDGRIPGYKVGRHLKFDLDEARQALRCGVPAPERAASATPDFDALDAA